MEKMTLDTVLTLSSQAEAAKAKAAQALKDVASAQRRADRLAQEAKAAEATLTAAKAALEGKPAKV